MLQNLLALFAIADWIALAIFAIGWFAYSLITDRVAGAYNGLTPVTHRMRLDWGRQMLRRENRITDASLIGNLMSSVSFYANTTIYIIAGLLAVAGTLDKLITFTTELPFARTVSPEIVEFKLFLLVGIFIFAYFKFTWCLRQFNFLSVLIGGAPPMSAAEEVLERYAQRFGTLNALAGDEFNRGIRAYYFGFAAITWFLNAAVFMAFTVMILIVLWRRDFHSHTYRALGDP